VRINRDYELMNAAVLTAVLGPILVSLDTDVLMKLLDLPASLTDFLLTVGGWMISCPVVSTTVALGVTINT
jgi:hypothetical protein